MKGMAPSSGRPKLDKPRARKEAAKTLAIALQIRYRKLLEAVGEDEIVVATADLAQCMYENVEFTLWALKVQGGMNPPPPEQLRKISPMKGHAPGEPNHVFQKPPQVEIEEPIPATCICEKLEPGIIGGDRHMVSCPAYAP